MAAAAAVRPAHIIRVKNSMSLMVVCRMIESVKMLEVCGG